LLNNPSLCERYTENVLSRRALLLSPLALAACRRKRGSGFAGYAFVANEGGQAIAAVDLTAFAVIRHIPVDGSPTAVIADPARPAIYALTPANGTVHQISTQNKLQVRRKLRVVSEALSMRMNNTGDALYVLCRAPVQLVRIDLATFAVSWRASLPAGPFDFDLAPNGTTAAVSLGSARSFVLMDSKSGETARIPARGDAGVVRFQSDGKALILANTSERMLSVYEVDSRRAVAHLPLALRPDNFCFKPDGGQLFVTGEGMDAVVVVYPYHTPQVAETVLAGRAPGAMAACDGEPGYLFVANPASSDVTILNIKTRRAIAVASVGAAPGYIAITPDNQYALVLNQESGDMAVLLITPKLGNREKSAPLFTMIPVGSKPVSAAIQKA
jgi:YVTN family beta-propeller protein